METECIYQFNKIFLFSHKRFFCFKVHRVFVTQPVFLQISVMVCWLPHSVHSPVWYLVLHDIPCISCAVMMVKVSTTAWHTCHWYSSEVQQHILWNRENWTAMGHVHGAGSVCELWPVARKMFIQNFAALKSKHCHHFGHWLACVWLLVHPHSCHQLFTVFPGP